MHNSSLSYRSRPGGLPGRLPSRSQFKEFKTKLKSRGRAHGDGTIRDSIAGILISEGLRDVCRSVFFRRSTPAQAACLRGPSERAQSIKGALNPRSGCNLLPSGPAPVSLTTPLTRSFFSGVRSIIASHPPLPGATLPNGTSNFIYGPRDPFL